MVGLMVSTTRIVEAPLEDAKKVLRRDRLAIEQSPDRIMTVLTYDDFYRGRSSYPGFNELGYEHHTGAWHGPFGEIEHEGREYWTEPTRRGSKTDRKLVLWYQRAIAAILQTSKFFAELKIEAKGTPLAKFFGGRTKLDFGKFSIGHRAPRSSKAEASLDRLWERLEAMKPIKVRSNLVSGNGEALFAQALAYRGSLDPRVKGADAPLTRAVREKKLTPEDARLIRMALVGLKNVLEVGVGGRRCSSLE
jgi:hypothetical protein